MVVYLAAAYGLTFLAFVVFAGSLSSHRKRLVAELTWLSDMLAKEGATRDGFGNGRIGDGGGGLT